MTEDGDNDEEEEPSTAAKPNKTGSGKCNKQKTDKQQQQHQYYNNRTFHKILYKWNQTDLRKFTTPALAMIEEHPTGALFVFIFGCLIFVPAILTLLFVVSTLVMTICGSFVVFGTFTSVAFLAIGVVAFFASLIAVALTAACLVGYNISSGIQELFII